LNVSTLQQRILKIEHEIDTSLAEKKKTQEREKELESEELDKAGIKGERKKNRGQRTRVKRPRILLGEAKDMPGLLHDCLG
jgi:hypothetical protein